MLSFIDSLLELLDLSFVVIFFLLKIESCIILECVFRHLLEILNSFRYCSNILHENCSNVVTFYHSTSPLYDTNILIKEVVHIVFSLRWTHSCCRWRIHRYFRMRPAHWWGPTCCSCRCSLPCSFFSWRLRRNLNNTIIEIKLISCCRFRHRRGHTFLISQHFFNACHYVDCVCNSRSCWRIWPYTLSSSPWALKTFLTSRFTCLKSASSLKASSLLGFFIFFQLLDLRYDISKDFVCSDVIEFS